MASGLDGYLSAVHHYLCGLHLWMIGVRDRQKVKHWLYGGYMEMVPNGHNDHCKDYRLEWLLLTALVALTTDDLGSGQSTASLSHAMKPGIPLKQTLIFCNHKAHGTESQGQSSL